MRRFIVKILVFIARKIDFITLQAETFNYFEKVIPKHALYIYELRINMLKSKEQIKNFQPDDEWE